jgi:outer membrane receptor protein involved in Fe transport
MGGRLSSTLAYFELENTGIVNSVVTGTNPATNLPVFTTFQSGAEASKGVELSGVYTPGHGWQLFYSYSYLDAYVKSDRSNPARVGLQLTNTAHQYFNVWAKYTVQEGRWKGLYVAGGVNYTGKRLVHISNQNLFWDTLPLVNISTGFEFKFDRTPIAVDVSCRNVTNEEYFPTNNARGDPRLFILSLSMRF